MSPVRRKKTPAKSAGNLSENRVFSRVVRIIVELLPLLIIFGGVAYGSVHLWQSGFNDMHYRIKPVSILENGDAYCPEAQAEFKRLAMLCKGRSLLDPMILREVKREYQASPWVSEVCAVRRVFPDRIFVSFVTRNGFAQVRQDGYYWLVDEMGVMLAVEGVRNPREALPVICGDISSRPGNGQEWHDQGLVGALDALKLLYASNVGRSLPVEGIKVCRQDYIDQLRMPGKSRPRLEMLTRNGVTILWGPAGEKLPGEIADKEKVDMLRQLVAECGTNPGLKFDIRTSVPGYSYTHATAR